MAWKSFAATNRATGKISTRKGGVVLAGVASAALALSAGPAFASGSTMSHGMNGSHTTTASSSGMSMVGNTRGWLAGSTRTFHYTKNYFCRMPPTSGATSRCELGATYDAIPAKDFDPLYVLVPLGFTPRAGTLQCPVAGKCIDHPHTIDLSRVFGAGTENALLPPHSHIVTTAAMGSPEWWNVIVVGVKDAKTWNKISSAKSYAEVQMLRRSGSASVTDNIPTNLFLYFSVRK